jgi:hypothetical protein
MGSGTDLECPGLRRLIVNAVYWGVKMEDDITPSRSVDVVGSYKPLSSGFEYEKIGVVPKLPSAYK